ncbi:hypothetical protein JCM8547_002484 [Rhodosporidiobolus lusitaniae]
MANRFSDQDPFAARGTNTVPPGGYDTDLQTAAPTTRAGTAATGVTGSGTNPRSAPLLSRTSGRTGTSGKSVKTPWYLTWAGIAGLIAALLIALGLGVGLGVGLGLKNNDSSASAASDNAASTVTNLSTLSQIVTAAPSTTVVRGTVSATNSASQVVQTSTVGGSTVVVSVDQGENTASRVIVTVSETLAPSTRTDTVYATTYASTQTVTTTLAGGAESTYYQTVTVQRTVTAAARAKRRRLEEKRGGVTFRE